MAHENVVLPTLSGTYYAKANKTDVKNFSISLLGSVVVRQFDMGQRIFCYDMTIAYFNKEVVGTYRDDRPAGPYSSFSGRDLEKP